MWGVVGLWGGGVAGVVAVEWELVAAADGLGEGEFGGAPVGLGLAERVEDEARHVQTSSSTTAG